MKCFRDLSQEGIEPGTEKNDRCMGLRDDWMPHVDIPAFVPNHHLITETIRRAEHIFVDLFIVYMYIYIYLQLFIYTNIYHIIHSIYYVHYIYILYVFTYTVCMQVTFSVRIQSIQAVKIDHDFHPDLSYNVVAPSYEVCVTGPIHHYTYIYHFTSCK